MKSNIIKACLFTAAIGVFSACENNDKYEDLDPTLGCVTATPTKTVADIYALTTPAPGTVGPVKLYEGNDIIEAYVTSSDAGGTFYKSISFQTLDATRAFSIPVDLYNIYTEFEPGRKVYINLGGRHYNQTYGSLLIGDLYNDPDTPTRDQIGRLVPEEFRRTVIASCDKVDEEVLVQHLTIAQAKNDANINKLIELSDVQFSDDAFTGEEKNYYRPNNNIGGATNLNLVDANGTSIIFRTSEFAKFANHRVPGGRGKVRGVLTKFNNDYQFLARTESDIQLTGARQVPVFQESFTNNFPNWVKFSVTGAQTWVLETGFGEPAPSAKISGFANGSNNANEDWLISPAIDLSGKTAATLSFSNAKNFAGNNIQVYISSDYSGSGAPSAATWTEITGATLSTTGFVFVSSGALDISSVAGMANVRVAFKYTSTSAASATWEIDNVKVVAN